MQIHECPRKKEKKHVFPLYYVVLFYLARRLEMDVPPKPTTRCKLRGKTTKKRSKMFLPRRGLVDRNSSTKPASLITHCIFPACENVITFFPSNYRHHVQVSGFIIFCRFIFCFVFVVVGRSTLKRICAQNPKSRG